MLVLNKHLNCSKADSSSESWLQAARGYLEWNLKYDFTTHTMTFRKIDFKDSGTCHEWDCYQEPTTHPICHGGYSDYFHLLLIFFKMLIPWITILEIVSYFTTLVCSSAFFDHSASLFLSLRTFQTPWSQILPKFCSWSVPSVYNFTFSQGFTIIVMAHKFWGVLQSHIPHSHKPAYPE